MPHMQFIEEYKLTSHILSNNYHDILFIKIFMPLIQSYNRLLYCKFTFYHASMMDSFLGLLIFGALLILRAHSVLLGFYYILGVLVL